MYFCRGEIRDMTIWQKVLSTLSFGRLGNAYHKKPDYIDSNGLKKVGIVGSPNVGKSVIFNNLTGAHVIVSNYPGTTVDVARGKAKIEGEEFEIVDTPGMYSLLPITEEERVSRLLLFTERPEVIIHAVDARNLDRMLPLTIQLIEAGLPVILDLNMMDESEAAGVEIDLDKLKEELNIPIVATVATSRRGMNSLRRSLIEYVNH